MKLLFENWRKFRNLLEAGDPDSDVDNNPEPAEVAKALELEARNIVGARDNQ